MQAPVVGSRVDEAVAGRDVCPDRRAGVERPDWRGGIAAERPCRLCRHVTAMKGRVDRVERHEIRRQRAVQRVGGGVVLQREARPETDGVAVDRGLADRHVVDVQRRVRHLHRDRVVVNGLERQAERPRLVRVRQRRHPRSGNRRRRQCARRGPGLWDGTSGQREERDERHRAGTNDRGEIHVGAPVCSPPLRRVERVGSCRT